MKIYIDLTNLLTTTYISGIQRVVREIISRLESFEDVPVFYLKYLIKEDAFELIREDYLLSQLKNGELESNKCMSKRKLLVSDIVSDDIFFDLDGVWHSTKFRTKLYPQLKKRNVKIVNLVYDIIPVMHPAYCHESTTVSFTLYLGAVLKYSDFIMANTQATIDNISVIANKFGINMPKTAVVPLGADFGGNASNNNKKESISKHVKDAVSKGKYVLMVGTLEPRKNHKYLLDALDSGLAVNVIFAGRKGWNVEDLTERIKNHTLNGKRLFWINDATDVDIDYLYKNAYYVVFPSFDEGYGLPIIESIMRGVPVLASDIPVLKEVGRNYAGYINNTAPYSLVDYINSMLNKPDEYQNNKDSLKEYVSFSWDQCAELVKENLRKIM